MTETTAINDCILNLLRSGQLDEKMAVSILGKVNRSLEPKSQDIAIIGMGCRFPGANTPEQFWRNVSGGVNSVGVFPEERIRELSPFIPDLASSLKRSGHTAGYLDNISCFDHAFFHMSFEDALAMEPYQRIFLQMAYQTLEDGGYGGEKLRHTSTGVFVGLETAYQSHYRSMLTDGTIASLTGSLVGLLSNRISYFLDLRGPAVVVNTACSSGLVALHQACMALNHKDCDVALAGGINLMLIPQVNSKLDDLETRGGTVKAFDKHADGTIWSEGTAALLLKPLHKALQDKDSIYGVIKGSSVNADGASNGLTAPNPEAETQLLLSAWSKAKIDPRTVSYIEAHGTGTLLGDSIELQALNDAFRQFTDQQHICGIGSVKTNIGHTVAASGLASLIKVVLAMKHNTIPASLHFTSPNPFIDLSSSPIYVNSTLRDWKNEGTPRRAGVNSFGFSGTNCHVVLEEAPEQLPEKEPNTRSLFILALSARSSTALTALVQEYTYFVASLAEAELDHLCYTANTGRGHYSHRLALVFASKHELQHQLCLLGSGLLQAELSKEQGIYTSEMTENRSDLLLSNSTLLDSSLLLEEMMSENPAGKKVYEHLCRTYVQGAEVDWKRLYPVGGWPKLHLPVYPFDPVKVWPAPPVTEQSLVEEPYGNALPSLTGIGSHPLEYQPFYRVEWSESLDAESSSLLVQKDTVMLITRATDAGDAFAAELQRHASHVIHVQFGTDYREIDPDKYQISAVQQDFDLLMKETAGLNITRIILSPEPSDPGQENLESLEVDLQHSLYALFYLTKALHRSRTESVSIVLLGRNVYSVCEGDQVHQPFMSALYGLGKVVATENPGLKCRCIDADTDTSLEDIAKDVLADGSNRYETAYRSGRKFHPQLTAAVQNSREVEPIGFKEQGVYLITGGTGGIGLALARNIVSKHKVKLILLARTQLPPHEQWKTLADENSGKMGVLLKELLHLEESNSEIYTYSADVAREEELAPVIRIINELHGRIDGIIHAAGLPGSGLLTMKDEQDFIHTMEPKIRGTRLLYELSIEQKPDFILLFSSVAAVVGGIYLGDYTAANSYMDAFSRMTATQGSEIRTFHWTTWASTGMAAGTDADLEAAFLALTEEEALAAFHQAMTGQETGIIIGELNRANDLFWNGPLPVALAPELRLGIRTPELDMQVIPTGRDDGSYSDVEVQLAHIWGNVFRIPVIDIHANFYELGGTSIMSIKIVNRMNEQFGITISVQDIFTGLTIANLARTVSSKRQEKGLQPVPYTESVSAEELIPGRECHVMARKFLPLSHSQKRIWFLQNFNPDLVAYNLPFIRTLPIRVDLMVLEQALVLLAGRHVMLRTSFRLHDGQPVQEIWEEYAPSVEQVDLRGHSQPEIHLHKHIYTQKMKPFDLETPPYRIYVYRLRDEDTLYINFHHTITDGWGIDVFYRELFAIYRDLLNHQPVRIAPAEYDYCDWITDVKAWEQSEDFRIQESYWLNELADPLPVLNLPVDYERPAIQTYHGSYRKFTITGEQYTCLKQYVEENQVTLSSFLLSAYFLLLHKLSGEDDIIVGVPTAGRQQRKWEEVIGIFINTFCIRVKCKELLTFTELQQQVKEKMLGALAHAQYPFDLLVEKVNPVRDLSRNPIYNVLFQFYDKLELDNEGISPFELSCLSRETEDRIEISLEFNTDLYSAETVEQFGGYYLHLIHQILQHPVSYIAQLELMTKQQQAEFLDAWQAPLRETSEAPVSDFSPLHCLFEERARSQPDAVALLFEDQQMTYKQLNERANRLAWLLIGQGIGVHSSVALLADRGFQTVIGILAILKAGGTYIPVDPQYPEERIRYILRHSEARVLLAEERFSEQFADIVDSVDARGQSLHMLSFNQIADVLSEMRVDNPPVSCGHSDLVYLMYTSGSTGQPKGVMVTHANVCNFIAWSMNEIGLGPEHVMMLATSVAFDISVFELFGALTSGAKLCIVSSDRLLDMGQLLEYIIACNVNVWHSVPGLMVQALAYLQSHSDHHNLREIQGQFRHILLGGEAWSFRLARRIREAFPTAELRNMYGPTEATIWIAAYQVVGELEDSGRALPIGAPVANNRLLVLDPSQNLCAPGVTGEIYIAGDSIAKGYYRDEKRTREAFIAQADGRIYYKTGDIGRYLPHEHIEFMGREDALVKVRGYRIELGEIESALSRLEGIREIALTTWKDGETNKIVCFYTAESSYTQTELTKWLRLKVPEYMIPAQYFWIERIVRTPNGKTDWKAMRELARDRESISAERGSRNEMDSKLLGIWSTLLGRSDIGIHENFFDIGGNSILLVQMQGEIRQQFGQDIPTMELFRYTSIEGLSDYLKERGGERNRLETGVETGQRRADIRKKMRNLRR